MTYTRKGKKITAEELKRYIVLEQRVPVMFETASGQWEQRYMPARTLVPPEFLKDKGKIEETNNKWGKIICKEYEERGLTPPPFMPIEFWITEPIEGVRELSIDKLSEEEIERILDFYSQKIEDDKKLKEKREIAERGQISVSLTRNLSLQRESALFDDLDKGKGLSLLESDKENYIDRKGRSIALTKTQNKIILALAHYLSQSQNDEDIQNYISALEDNPRILPKSKIERSINLRDFDKAYTSQDGKTRPRQITALREELRKTAQIKQVLYFGDTKRKARLITPLISVEEELEDITPDKSLNLDYINIRFSPVFLYKMTKEFSPISASFIRLLGKKGSGTDTELFQVLLNDLLSKYPQYRLTALTKTHNVRRADFHTKEEYLAEYDKVQRKSLTCVQNVSTLLEKITTDYSSCKQYRAKFRRDLEKALIVLRDELNLIKDGKVVKNSKGEEALKVVFNPEYNGGGEKW